MKNQEQQIWSSINCIYVEMYVNVNQKKFNTFLGQPVYSLSTFTCRGRFTVFLNEFLLKIKFQWQFWILLVLRIPKHPQKVEFDEDLAELLKVKHNTSHMKNFQLLRQQQS